MIQTATQGPTVKRDSENPQEKVITCPAGWYYVGDPCYAASHQTGRWAEYGESSGWFQTDVIATAGSDAWCIGFGTAYGDGAYRDQGDDTSEGRNMEYNRDFEYGVDSGLLGVVPMKFAQTNALYAMQLVHFPKPFDCWSRGGVIRLGPIAIDTNGEESDSDSDWCSNCGETPHHCLCDEDIWADDEDEEGMDS